MGLVYEVEHVLMAKRMALKILKTEHLTEAVWKRFRAEGQAIARLDHANIVRIYDMSQSEDGVPFYTMDLITGMSLADYLQDYGRMSQSEALPVFRQVCAGLAYAHEHGIIHRDIKPGNIMLIGLSENDNKVADKQVKIVDFGIAKLTDESGNTIQGLTKPGEVFGSPLYMSPEQCNGQKVDQRSDLYSVGITLFQVLTGKPPLLGKTAIETTIMHQTTVPPTLSEALAKAGRDADGSASVKFSPRLEQVVATMLEKLPEDRYSSLSEVARELLQIERGDTAVPLELTRSGHKRTQIDGRSDLRDLEEPDWQENTGQNSLFATTNIVAIAAVLEQIMRQSLPSMRKPAKLLRPT